LWTNEHTWTTDIRRSGFMLIFRCKQNVAHTARLDPVKATTKQCRRLSLSVIIMH
jgi:hypothetical protein